jgi:hypothetical protein
VCRFNTEISALQQKLDAANHRIEQLQVQSEGLSHFGTISFTPGGPETTVYAPNAFGADSSDARARRITNVHKPVTGVIKPVNTATPPTTSSSSSTANGKPPLAAQPTAPPKASPELAQKKPFLYI